jgi:hypothetical protein
VDERNSVNTKLRTQLRKTHWRIVPWRNAQKLHSRKVGTKPVLQIELKYVCTFHPVAYHGDPHDGRAGSRLKKRPVRVRLPHDSFRTGEEPGSTGSNPLVYLLPPKDLPWRTDCRKTAPQELDLYSLRRKNGMIKTQKWDERRPGDLKAQRSFTTSKHFLRSGQPVV